MPASGTLVWKCNWMPSAGWIWMTSRLASSDGTRSAREHHVRRAAELDDDLRRAARHRLAAAQVERHALPAPVVDLQFQHGERGGAAVRRDARLLRGRTYTVRACVSRATSSSVTGRIAQHLDFFIAHQVGLVTHGASMAVNHQQLQQMVLEHVAQDARRDRSIRRAVRLRPPRPR